MKAQYGVSGNRVGIRYDEMKVPYDQGDTGADSQASALVSARKLRDSLVSTPATDIHISLPTEGLS